MKCLSCAASALLFLLLLSSCARKTHEDDHSEKFRAFAAKFKTLALPCTLYAESHSDENLETSLPDTSDSLFVNHEIGYATYFGKLPDTSDFFAMIMLYPADDMVPALVTYTKDGQKKDDQVIIARGCTFGEGIIFCESRVIIDEELNLFLRDSLIYCNEEKLLNQDTTGCTAQVLTQRGKVEKDGKIRLSEKTGKKITF